MLHDADLPFSDTAQVVWNDLDKGERMLMYVAMGYRSPPNTQDEEHRRLRDPWLQSVSVRAMHNAGVILPLKPARERTYEKQLVEAFVRRFGASFISGASEALVSPGGV